VAKSGVISWRRTQSQRKGRRFQDVSASDHRALTVAARKRVFRSARLRRFVAETRGFLIIMMKVPQVFRNTGGSPALRNEASSF